MLIAARRFEAKAEKALLIAKETNEESLEIQKKARCLAKSARESISFSLRRNRQINKLAEWLEVGYHSDVSGNITAKDWKDWSWSEVE